MAEGPPSIWNWTKENFGKMLVGAGALLVGLHATDILPFDVQWQGVKNVWEATRTGLHHLRFINMPVDETELPVDFGSWDEQVQLEWRGWAERKNVSLLDLERATVELERIEITN